MAQEFEFDTPDYHPEGCDCESCDAVWARRLASVRLACLAANLRDGAALCLAWRLGASAMISSRPERIWRPGSQRPAPGWGGE